MTLLWIGLTALVVGLFVGTTSVGGVILMLYISPAKHWWEQSRTANAQEQELDDLTSENRGLKERVRALRDPGALEREARRLGMVRQGERAYVIEGLPK